MGLGFAEILLRISCSWCWLEEQEFPGVSGDREPGSTHSLGDARGCRQQILAEALEAAQEPPTGDTIAHLPPLSELNAPLQEC